MVIGTDSGALVVVQSDGSVLSKRKFKGEVQFVSWSPHGELAVVTRTITPAGERASLELPAHIELMGYAAYLT